MNHLNCLPIKIGAMSDTRVIISCVNYNHETLLISNFQEQIVDQLVDHYHTRLMENKAAISKLLNFGIGIPDIKKLKIGLCDRKLNRVVACSRCAEGASIRGILEVHGLIKPSGHEELRGCVTLPLYDENGLVLGIYGRRMAQYIRREGRRHILWLATQDAINKLNFPAKIVELHYDE
ncbi:hypothetical protein [Thalassotalea sp. PS06]|uniref:hypothetical protein n=1 Tax=Thalassotalea sp. PS06 TaxID=2594005 RepID=UPI0011628A14|nr:hypothetical protein [Thalassotalea sp. PS06]QDP01557.1 hypothetical protein FNC98_09545 [Thalassotalea sp. PS06]